jgi:hypothetical protein
MTNFRGDGTMKRPQIVHNADSLSALGAGSNLSYDVSLGSRGESGRVFMDQRSDTAANARASRSWRCSTRVKNSGWVIA